MVIWHGWADGAIVATSSIGYYEDVLKFMGGRKQTENFLRLFLIPGVHHGGGGPGLTDFDAFTALEDWVEKEQAPEKLIASRLSGGVVERSRPVFPYLNWPIIRGKETRSRPIASCRSTLRSTERRILCETAFACCSFQACCRQTGN